MEDGLEVVYQALVRPAVPLIAAGGQTTSVSQLSTNAVAVTLLYAMGLLTVTKYTVERAVEPTRVISLTVQQLLAPILAMVEVPVFS
jgi:hypothetical protein